MFANTRRACVAAGLLSLALTGYAQSSTDPTQADAKVLVQDYQSVFQTYRRADSDQKVAPNAAWLGANAAVADRPATGGMNGMSGMSEHGGMQHQMTMPMPAMAPAPLPAESPKPATGHDHGAKKEH